MSLKFRTAGLDTQEPPDLQVYVLIANICEGPGVLAFAEVFSTCFFYYLYYNVKRKIGLVYLP